MKKSYFSKNQSEDKKESIKRGADTQVDTLNRVVLVTRIWVLTFQ